MKPARTRHCSVCDRCVFNYEHHCPFVNNCIGLENHRYYLLFLIYNIVAQAHMLVSIVAIKSNHVFEQNKSLLYTIAGIDVVVGFFMTILCF